MIRFLMVALVAVGAWLAVRWLVGGRRLPDFQCVTCTHCRKLFYDGVMCGFREKEVFKNPTQISMCPDHEPRRSAPGSTLG